MSKLRAALVVSVIANIALLWAWQAREKTVTSARTLVPPSASESSNPTFSAPQLAAMLSGDAAELNAAGVPADVARQLLVGRAYVRMHARLAALKKGKPTTDKYWAGLQGVSQSAASKQERAEMNSAQKEFSEALRVALGDDGSSNSNFDQRFGYLPPAKADQLRRIEQDYGEMQGEIYMEMGGMPFPSDQKRLKLLEAEKQRDIAAALTPEELEAFNLRASPTANNLRGRFGDSIQTEEDYRKIFRLQKAFDDQYATLFSGGPVTAEVMQARNTAERKMYNEMRASLGEVEFSALMRAGDFEYKSLSAIATRLNLPASTPDKVYATRDRYAALSKAINDDGSLTLPARREALKALSERARTDLQQTLGAEARDIYSTRSNWMNLLSSGSAFTTDPSQLQPGAGMMGNSTVYPLQPKPAQIQPAPGR